MADLAPASHQLTPELARQLIGAVKAGLFKESAARCCGVAADDLDTWLRMGLSPGAVEPYRSFAKAFVAQEDGQQLKHIDAIQQAAGVDWRASIAWLQLRYPETWGPKATKNRPASSLTPSAADEAAEEELVRQLIAARPPVLVRLLTAAGWVSPPADQPPPGAQPPG